MRVIFSVYVVNFFASPLYDYLYSIFGINLYFFDKIFLVIFVLFLVFFVIRTRCIYLKNFELLLLLMAISSILLSLLFVEIDFAFLAPHLFQILSPFLAISFGASAHYREADFDDLVLRIASKFVPILIVLTFGYLLLHFFTPIWPYFGYSSGIVFAYWLSVSRASINRAIFFLIAVDFFTGKRSSLVLWFLSFFVIGRRVAVLILCVSFIAVYFSFDVLPARYQNTLYFDIMNVESWARATGGRSSEWLSVWKFLESKDLWWLYGTGFGQAYLLTDDISGYTEKRHYIHNHFLLQVYLMGLLPALLFQFYILYWVISLVTKSKYVEGRVIFFFIFYVLSFLSASLAVELLPWVIFGSLRSARRNCIVA